MQALRRQGVDEQDADELRKYKYDREQEYVHLGYRITANSPHEK